MKTLRKINNDLLKVGLTQPEGFYEELTRAIENAQVPTPYTHQKGVWTLVFERVVKKVKKVKEITTITIHALAPDGVEGFKAVINDYKEAEAKEQMIAIIVLPDGRELGELTLNASARYKSIAFFTFTNRRLYERGSVTMLAKIADGFGMKVKSITQVDVALDVNKNIVSRTQKHISNTDKFDMVLNGKKVEDAFEVLDGVGEFFGRSRKKRMRFPTLYLHHRRDDGLGLRLYDKGKEIANESGKDYIVEANGFKGIYRCEASVKWEQFKRWLSYLATSGDETIPFEWKRTETDGEKEDWSDYVARSLFLLEGADYRLALWNWATDHVLYFRSREAGAKVSMLDIMS